MKKISNEEKSVNEMLLRIAESDNVAPFSSSLDHLFKELHLGLEESAKPQLVSYGKNAYQRITNIYEDLKNLEKEGFISYATTASLSKFTQIGDISTEKNYFISEDVSNFFIQHINDNIVLLYKCKDYIKAKRCLPELRATKKQTMWTIWSVIIAIASVIITLIINYFK